MNIYVHVVTRPANGNPAMVCVGLTDIIQAGLLDVPFPMLKYTSHFLEKATKTTIEKPLKTGPYATVINFSFTEKR